MPRGLPCAALMMLAAIGAFAQDRTTRPVFEVASVRQTTPSTDGRPVPMRCSGGPGTSDPERFSCTNAPLKMLICLAYEVQYYQVNGPGWMDTDGYDIAAKIPTGVTRAQYRIMLQTLLTERFQLALHRETKDVTTHTLVVARSGSKMQRSIDESPTKNTAIPPGLVVSMVGEDVRVTAKKQQLNNLAGFLSTKLGVEGPVANETGLTGDYDFVLEFTPEASLATAKNGLSLFTALESELGLKLEAKKTPVDVIFVDHTEKKPTDN